MYATIQHTLTIFIVLSAPGSTYNLEEADHGGRKYSKLTIFHKSEHLPIPIKTIKQRKIPKNGHS